jgi:CHASE2 domain-containing sensor protein
MSKKAPFLIEVGLGVLITGLVAWSYAGHWTFTDTASLKTYDLFSKFRTPPAKSDAINIVEIDEESVGNLGRWPWPRSLVGQLVDEVVGRGAQVIGLNV